MAAETTQPLRLSTGRRCEYVIHHSWSPSTDVGGVNEDDVHVVDDAIGLGVVALAGNIGEVDDLGGGGVGTWKDGAEVVIGVRVLRVGGLERERVRVWRQLFGMRPVSTAREVTDEDLENEEVDPAPPRRGGP